MRVITATVMPAAVQTRASATPPVTAWGCPRPDTAMRLKEFIMPMMVPRSPRRGERVMMVSRAGRPRRMRESSATPRTPWPPRARGRG